MPQGRKLIPLILAMLLLAQDAIAGAWPRKKDGGFLQVGFSTIGYSSVYGDDGTKRSLPVDVRDNVLQFFGEYGISDDMTVTLAVPVKFLSVRTNSKTPLDATQGQLVTGHRNGFGDLDFGIRKNWWQGDGYVFSTEMVAGIPTGDYEDERGYYLGDSEANLAFRALLGKSWYPVPLYASADMAFNFRSRDFPNDVFYSLEVGYSLFESRVVLIMLLSGRASTSRSPTTTPTTSRPDNVASELGILTKNQEYTAITPKLVFKVTDNWGITAAFATAVHGRNVAGGAVLAGSVFYDF